MKTFSPHFEILEEAQRCVWTELMALPEQFVLYGGTAIALRLGHRKSVDFDFFSTPSIDNEALLDLPFMRSCKVIQNQKETLSVIIDRGGPVKVSFFGGLEFGRIGEPEKTADQILCVASLPDLFAHKLKVILQRVECKDYADIAAILRSGRSLAEGLEGALGLFGTPFPPVECIKALSYFEGGDLNELPDAEREVLIASIRRLPKTFIKKPLVSLDLRPDFIRG